jgi:hypothetical protein
MGTPTTNMLKMIDSTMLTPLLRKALYHDDAEVIDWRDDDISAVESDDDIEERQEGAGSCANSL